ncbi:MAG: DoxX family protein [Cyclobacteriaceae bacterium]|nr:DoxX family protein [Cyclobacteriaceae bacterium HetDA_MAG_MS6]
MFSALVSVIAQFIAGCLFLVGFQVRWAALLMMINFVIAIVAVHIGDSYTNTFPALTILAGSVFLFMNGAGRFSIDSHNN